MASPGDGKMSDAEVSERRAAIASQQGECTAGELHAGAQADALVNEGFEHVTVKH
jgi:hypothetical protein